MANRLAAETSPYLLQHKDNPVDWYPWGEEAFAKAKAEDKPVFLSVGYSSCHWCHVMEHESFEDADVAAILNASFISVKVDREELPDVDEAYMTAVQLSSGRGGWPMSVFLTPDRKPFFAGTYFPKDNRGQHPGFLTIVGQIAAIWKSKRAELEDNAKEFALGLAEAIGKEAPATFSTFDEEFLANAVRALAADFDNEHGGFGGAPKFPPHTSIEFLLRYALRESAPEDLRGLAIGMALSTLEQMALGGIHDQVGGGFHRYSTDEHWLLPHFEKMLYDNALMLANYSLGAALIHDVHPHLEKLFGRAAHRIAFWTLTEMLDSFGLFCSALDADSEGEEGKFYVWTMAEIRELLGDQAQAFIEAYGIKAEGNFEDEATGHRTGANIPHLQAGHDPMDEALMMLLEARGQRVKPGRDDKALVGWNGLMIAALAQSGVLDYAGRAASQILAAEESLGELPHQVVNGTPSGKAYLDDYASFAWSLFVLARASDVAGQSGAEWMGHAERLTERMVQLFWDEERGGFFSTSTGHEQLFGRSKPAFDSPTPSANATALRCLVEIGDNDRANKLLTAFLGWMERAPQATEALYTAAMPLALPGEVRPVTVAEPVKPAEVTVRMEPREIKVGPDGVGRGEVILDIPPSLHINSNTPPARWLTPTILKFEPVKAEIAYPAGVDDVYEGEVRIPFTVALPSGSSGEEFEVRVAFQPCTDTECLLPTEKVLNGVVAR